MIDVCPGKEPKQLPVGNEHKRDVIPGKPNIHFASCGIPPTLTPGLPTGYFDNGGGGDQWVMQFDLETGICRVWCGDCGWDNEMRVDEINGRCFIRFLTPEEGGKNRDEARQKLLERWPTYFEESRKAIESVVGRITNDEFNRFECRLCFPSQDEVDQAAKFYRDNMAARDRFLKARERERIKAEREAEEARRKQAQAERQASRERLVAEEKALRESIKALKREQREEVELLRAKIRETKRLIRGDEPQE